jgi:ABC-type phosphate transport system permease subunit
VVLQASIAPLASHVSNHAKKFAHVTVKELVVVFNYMLQILHTLLHRFHGLETFIDRRAEIPDGLMASSATHRMQSEGVFIAIVSTVVTAVVATSIVVWPLSLPSLPSPLGPSGVLSLGCASQM